MIFPERKVKIWIILPQGRFFMTRIDGEKLAEIWHQFREQIEGVAEQVFGAERAKEKHQLLTARLINLPINAGNLESLVNDGRKIDQPLSRNGQLNLPVVLIGHDAKDMEKLKIGAFGTVGVVEEMALLIEKSRQTLTRLDLLAPPPAAFYEAYEEGDHASTAPHRWMLIDYDTNSDFSVFVDPDGGKALGLVMVRAEGELIIVPKAIDVPVGYTDIFDRRTGMMID